MCTSINAITKYIVLKMSLFRDEKNRKVKQLLSIPNNEIDEAVIPYMVSTVSMKATEAGDVVEFILK